MQSLTVIEKTLLIRAMERKGGVGDMQCAPSTHGMPAGHYALEL